MADHAPHDEISPVTPAPVSALSASTPSGSTPSGSSPLPVPQRSVSPAAAENTPFSTSYPAASNQAPPQGYAPHPSAGYPAFPYYGAGGVADAAAAAGAAGADADAKTYAQRLSAGEEFWQWKAGLRLLLIIVDIIAIGAAISVTVSGTRSDSYDSYYFDDAYAIPFTLIPLVVSAVWCLVYVLVLALRKPPRAAHPGIAVGIDLILWLTFVITLLVSVSATLSLNEDRSDDTFDDPYDYLSSRYSGCYTKAPNGTWVYEVTYVDGNYARRGVPTAAVVPRDTLVPVSAEATATPATTSASSATATPAATEAPSAAAARRALEFSLSSASDPYETYSYDSYSSYDAYDTYDTFDDYTYNYYDTSSTSSSPSSSSPSSTLTGDLYVFTTVTRGSYRTTSDGYAFYTNAYTAYTATIARTCAPDFASCAQQDARVNAMWHAKGRRHALDLLISVVQGIALVAHFALFVWACVDTHRRNRLRRTNAAMAMSVLQDMRSRGYVMVPAADALAVQAAHGRGAAYPADQAAVPEMSRAAGKAPMQEGMPHYG